MNLEQITAFMLSIIEQDEELAREFGDNPLSLFGDELEYTTVNATQLPTDTKDFDPITDKEVAVRRSGVVSEGKVLFQADSEGGYEGAGEHAHVVWGIAPLLPNGNVDLTKAVYIKRDGWYASYQGTEWDDDLTITVPNHRQVVDWS